MITINYVITELVSLLTSPLRMPRPRIIATIKGLKAASHIEIVHIDQARDERAWTLLTQRPDKLWSLADCSSFVVMQELGLTQALTSAPHFEQAGFMRLLK